MKTFRMLCCLGALLLSLHGVLAQYPSTSYTSPVVAEADSVKPRNKKEFDLFYTRAHLGDNISLNYNHFFGRHAVTIGTKFHLNEPVRNNGSRYDGWTFYEPHFRSCFSVNLGYKFDLLRQPRWLSPYLFYQLQFTSGYQLEYRYDSGRAFSLGPHTTFEYIIGAGVMVPVHKNVFVNGSVGIGDALIIDESFSTSPKMPRTHEFARMFRAGVTYQFRLPRKTK